MKLGFSLYPEGHSLSESKGYIDLLASYGASRLFMSLLQLKTSDQDCLEHYRYLIKYAKDKDIDVIADISPDFIKSSPWRNRLIEEVKAFGLTGLRLDESLSVAEMVELTQNDYGIKIELNMSTEKELLSDLLLAGANRDNLVGCHNFYPHEWTGLSMSHFLEMSNFYRCNAIPTAAFINAQTATEGPWELSEGLCSLEECRHLTISNQIALLKMTGVIDTVIIANQFITKEELDVLHDALNASYVRLELTSNLELTDTELAIIAHPHSYRGDRSDYVIRSTQPRLTFAEKSVTPRVQERQVRAGTVLIDNDLYGRYKGELQIALKEFTVSEKVNVVGQLTPESLLLLDYLKPWQHFQLLLLK